MFQKFWLKHKNQLVVFLLSASITFLFLFLHRNHTLHFNMNKNDFIYRLEAMVLDAKYRYRGSVPHSKKIGILAIDDYTLTKFGRWPFSRRYYVKAFENLKKMGVEWIGFDVVFSEPELESLKDFLELKKATDSSSVNWNLLKTRSQSSSVDENLAESIRSFGNMVLGYNYMGSKFEVEQSYGKNTEKYFSSLEQVIANPLIVDVVTGKSVSDYKNIATMYGINNNIPTIAKASDYFGFFSNAADDDAVNRWITLLAKVDQELVPSLSLRLAANILKSDILVGLDSYGEGVEKLILVSQENNEELRIPLDNYGYGRLLVNPLGGDRSVPHFSLAKAYEQSFSAEELSQMKGMSLILGPTSSGINDQRPNAFDSVINGVENHAHAVDNIVSKRFLQRPSHIIQLEWMIMIGVAFVLVPFMMFASAIWSSLAMLLVLGCLYWIDYRFWFGKGIWAYLTLPTLQVVLIYSFSTLFKFIFEENEKRKVRSTFGQYLSPDVIAQVLEDPDSQKLGGARKDVTIFFSDVRGFTDISEKLSAEKLGELMNAYFNAMTPSILASAGTLDKFIGDAIMAFWGAPIQQQDQADRACKASIAMLYELPKVKDKLKAIGIEGVDIDIGIGLNSGSASIGNFGSSDRFCYTAMGDSVNLASRLEGLTKKFGIKILVSETTRSQVKSQEFFFRDIAILTVKGKEQPVRVYELMHPNFLPNRENIEAFIKLFDQGRSLYQERKWVEAESCFKSCLAQVPHDVPTQQYLEDIEEFKSNPPDPSWDGVKRFTTK